MMSVFKKIFRKEGSKGFSSPLFYTLFAICCVAFAATDAKADDAPEGEPLFTIINDSRMWDINKEPGVEMISLLAPGETRWKTKAFTFAGTYMGLWTGLSVPYTAYIENIEPVKDKIGTVSAYIVLDRSYVTYLNGIKLLVAEDNTFADCQEIEAPIQAANSTFWNFEIPEPAENLYYRLCIDFNGDSKVRNAWLDLESISFYAAADDSTGGDNGEENPGGDNGDEDDEGDDEGGNGETVGVITVETDSQHAGVKWYNPQGLEVKNPQKGLFIRVESGESRKVVL